MEYLYLFLSLFSKKKLNQRLTTLSHLVSNQKEIKHIASTLNLNEIETRHLISEVKREINEYNTSHVFISLLPDAFVDQFLPVSLHPQPQKFYRYIFYVKPSNQKISGDLDITKPVKRQGYYFIETGVLSDH